jgi:hypothetical protein
LPLFIKRPTKEGWRLLLFALGILGLGF